jgi:uncharacterized protein YecT (DUF1311 family)
VATGVAAAEPDTQLGMNQAAGAELEKADRELNAVFQQIVAEYADDPAFVAKLRTAQRAWVALRDADLAAAFPHADEPGRYGSVLPACLAMRKTALTEARTAELRRWVAGTREGDVCAGSLKVR